MIIPDCASDTPISIILSEPGEDTELKAISYIASVLHHFPQDGRERILNYLYGRFPKIGLQETER